MRRQFQTAIHRIYSAFTNHNQDLTIGRAALFLLLCLPAAAFSGSIKLNDKGIEIDGGNMGTFQLKMLSIQVKGNYQDPIEVRLNGNELQAKYAAGIRLSIKLEDKETVALRFSGDTSNLTQFKLSEFHIPFNYADGGTWMIGDDPARPFPREQPAKPFLYQGNASKFQLASLDGQKIRIGIPPYSYQQLQDNREWGWKIFDWWCQIPFNKDWDVHKITVQFDQSDAQAVKLVDRFGQSTRKAFPGKISRESELKSDAENESAYYQSLQPPPVDRWGGLPTSGEKLGLKKTGFFHVEQRAGRWILVDPDGNAFFHLGICSFGFTEDYTTIAGRESIYEWLPSHDGAYKDAWHTDRWWNPRAVSFYKANLIRKYGRFNQDEWTGMMVDRIRRMGFNSIGAFSGSPVFKEKGIPYVAHLPLGQQAVGKFIPGIRGVFDPFDDTVLKKMDEQFAGSVAALADEPLIIGYFLENEQAMEDIPRVVPTLDGAFACKRELVDRLRKKYGTVDAFNRAWGTEAVSFDALRDQGLPVTTEAAFEDIHGYLEHFLDAYYRSVVQTFRKYDRHHLLIGNRWQPGTANNETLCRVAGRYLDVVSINYYADRIDEPYIRRLYQWTGGKPQIWSEFYYTSDKESNVSGSGLDVASQQARGQAYRQYVEGAAALGFVVGVEWFTLIDQAVTGRFFEEFNGERNNTGLFNVLDRPYKPLIAEMVKTHQALYDVWLNGKAPYVFDHPRFRAQADTTRSVTAGRAVGTMVIDGKLTGWPNRPSTHIASDRLVSGSDNKDLQADFKVCWDDTHLYILVNVTDESPMQNEHTGADIWNADAIELFIGSRQLEQPGPLLFSDRQVLIGAGQNNQVFVANIARQPVIESVVAPFVDRRGYTMEAALPWASLAIEPKEGLELIFDLAIDASGDGTQRKTQLMWNGIARNSSDRSAWGRLKLQR